MGLLLLGASVTKTRISISIHLGKGESRCLKITLNFVRSKGTRLKLIFVELQTCVLSCWF